jgi:hypothetical protein
MLNTIFLCDILDLKWTIITASKAISITYCGSNNKDSINRKMVMKPVQMYHAGKPSLYSTIKNTLYINASGSGCGGIRRTGKNTIARTCI